MEFTNFKNFILVGALLAIMAFSSACQPKSPKPGEGLADHNGGSGDMIQPGGVDGSVTGAPLTPKQIQEGARDPGYAETSALRDVFFDFDRSDLREDSRAALEANASWMKSNPKMKVQVEGHCDERGTEEYNLALGERRASSVKNYLISLGVDGRRLYTISYGEELPLDPGHSEDSWSKNRRAHFVATEANF